MSSNSVVGCCVLTGRSCPTLRAIFVCAMPKVKVSELHCYVFFLRYKKTFCMICVLSWPWVVLYCLAMTSSLTLTTLYVMDHTLSSFQDFINIASLLVPSLLTTIVLLYPHPFCFLQCVIFLQILVFIVGGCIVRQTLIFTMAC